MNPEDNRLLAAIDSIREGVATGTPCFYRFFWKSPSSNRITEVDPFSPPPPNAVVHVLLSIGPNDDAIRAEHAPLVEVIVESLSQTTK